MNFFFVIHSHSVIIHIVAILTQSMYISIGVIKCDLYPVFLRQNFTYHFQLFYMIRKIILEVKKPWFASKGNNIMLL